MKAYNRKRLFLFYFCSLFLLVPFLLIVPVKAQEEDENPIYVTSADIIKNFKFDKFAGTELENNRFAGGKLLFESGPNWRVDKEDIEELYTHTVGNRTYFNYLITFRNDVNIITNVRVSQCAERGLRQVSNRYRTLRYREYYWEEVCEEVNEFFEKCKNKFVRTDKKTERVKFYHYDFGNIRTYNARVNSFSGALEMTFDIDDSPLPDFFNDEEGEQYVKKFDYIAISSASAEENKKGLLSDDDIEIKTITPEEYDSESGDRKSWTGDKKRKVGASGEKKTFDFNIKLKDEGIINTFDEGILPMSDNANLFPTQKDGSDIFNPQQEEESQEDARIKYQVGRISPLVEEYGAKLKFDSYDVKHKIDGWGFHHWKGTSGKGESYTKPSALHTKNRYIQAGLKITFNIWSAYEVKIEETEQLDERLQDPKEYYDELIWSAIVDGAGGVEFEEKTETPFDDFFNALAEFLSDPLGLFSSILTIIIIIAVIYVVVKVVRGRASGKTKVEIKETRATPTVIQAPSSEMRSLQKQLEEQRREIRKQKERQAKLEKKLEKRETKEKERLF